MRSLALSEGLWRAVRSSGSLPETLALPCSAGRLLAPGRAIAPGRSDSRLRCCEGAFRSLPECPRNTVPDSGRGRSTPSSSLGEDGFAAAVPDRRGAARPKRGDQRPSGRQSPASDLVMKWVLGSTSRPRSQSMCWIFVPKDNSLSTSATIPKPPRRSSRRWASGLCGPSSEPGFAQAPRGRDVGEVLRHQLPVGMSL